MKLQIRRIFVPGLLAFALMLCLSDVLSAQSIAMRVVAVPLPPWRDEAVLVGGGPRAYFDASTNQIVVTSRKTASDAPDLLRLDIANGARPFISFNAKVSGRRILYSYVATDDIKAPQKSQKIGILLPDHDSDLSTGGTWPSDKEATSLADSSPTVAFGKTRIVSWTDPSTSSQKLSGLTFRIESTYLPGFADAYVWGKVANPLGDSDLRTLPESVRKELGPFMQSRYGQSTQMVLGPVFPPGTPKKIVAANYHFALQHLMGHNRLDRKSAFANSLLNSLTDFLGFPSLDSSIVLPSERPESALEIEIDSAIRLALR